jgi:hypothetical protein
VRSIAVDGLWQFDKVKEDEFGVRDKVMCRKPTWFYAHRAERGGEVKALFECGESQTFVGC